MADKFSTMIIAAEDADIARNIAASFGIGGVGMWITPLSADGNEPATNYISTGYMASEFVDMAPNTVWAQEDDGSWVEVSYYPGDPVAVHAYTEQVGLPYTLEEIEGVFSRADVSEQEPFVAMGRLGLTIITPQDA